MRDCPKYKGCILPIWWLQNRWPQSYALTSDFHSIMRGESTCRPASPPHSCFGSLVGDKKRTTRNLQYDEVTSRHHRYGLKDGAQHDGRTMPCRHCRNWMCCRCPVLRGTGKGRTDQSEQHRQYLL